MLCLQTRPGLFLTGFMGLHHTTFAKKCKYAILSGLGISGDRPTGRKVRTPLRQSFGGAITLWRRLGSRQWLTATVRQLIGG